MDVVDDPIPMVLDNEAADSEATKSDADADTEDEGVEHGGQAAAQQRSRANSPTASAPSDSAAAAAMDEGYARLTARQRARLEKEAGIAEDVAWHEMDLLPNLTYTWKGKGIKATGQMTEEEWLKRQEALERRRMRSLRDKREAEEAVKAKIRRAVTARFRAKMGESGLDGQGGGGEDQEGASVRPGWVKMRYTAEGVSVAWHPAAHSLSLPVPVVAVPTWPSDPIELPLEPPQAGKAWQVPQSSSSSFKAGCSLTLQPAASKTSALIQQSPTAQQQLVQLQEGPYLQALLSCADGISWTVGCLLQQHVLEAIQEAAPLADQPPGQPQLPVASGIKTLKDIDWQRWRAVVKSIRRAPGNPQHLVAVVVRLVPQDC